MNALAADRKQWARDHAAALRNLYGPLDGEGLVKIMSQLEFRGRIALVSSFGAESAVLLHLVAKVDRSIPVIFLDTDKLFGETLRYRDRLTRLLGLTDVRTIEPDPVEVERRDPNGVLWRDNPDACCRLRKVEPLARALEGFDAWFTGRKRFQTSERAALPNVESANGLVKVNPLISWDQEALEAYRVAYNLPPHPLVEDGYVSIGCMPCTDRVADGGEYRDGRWAGTGKRECGIHLEAEGSGI
ncbi:phosphoadenylyl-sulfate reductase [Zavarzinia compransoris]|uniref:Adenosine 5'-phosphosulfate reductase n=1 Tax=Zavarzinia compransoris TaxID=1264899 RepID=A0A317DTN6_9PROT|nr:phosphoadenylyl-sulfate reductase [Zavarzinia compransoris]PWR18021.1 phosphoadenylyl-sulfate reductase [Zavarzinia compransoris]TDP43514.1 phosphoadenosine phosphosulfate reductase [Zavarzinia compransoris]